MPTLGVNIDHIATIRQARYRASEAYGEPDVVRAAVEAEIGGAQCITVHLREDRRHIVDRDLDLLRQTVRVKLNLEMAATDEMVGVALSAKPHMVTLVPEGRMEVTTEGGLDVGGATARLREVVGRLHDAGILASAFIDADLPQAQACRDAGFDYCEVHTGPYAAAWTVAGGDITSMALQAELERVAMAGAHIRGLGMRLNAGHALNYHNVHRIAALPGMCELHIGHAIVSRAVFVGLREAVREMVAIIDRQGLRAETS